MIAPMTMPATAPAARPVAAVEYDVVTLMPRHGTPLLERQRMTVQHGLVWHGTFEYEMEVAEVLAVPW